MNTDLKFTADFFIDGGHPDGVQLEFYASGMINARGVVVTALQANGGVWIDNIYYPARRILRVRLGHIAQLPTE